MSKAKLSTVMGRARCSLVVSHVGQRGIQIALLATMLIMPVALRAQAKVATKPTPRKQKQPAKSTPAVKPVDELSRLREEYIKASREYKASLEKLQASYEKSAAKAADELAKSRELFAVGLIARKDVEASESRFKLAKDKVAEVEQQMAAADSQIANTLLEAEAETKLAKARPIPRGGLVRTTAMIRYNGGAAWSLSDAWKVQRFFLDAFKRPLPVAVFGQGAIHDRWRLDHHNSMDVSLQPDGAEGQALLSFLRANGIPFLAFRQAIPGTATGSHIHIGRPSHRY